MNTMERQTIRAGGRVAGAVRVPGDKSISHRAAMLAGLAGGHSTLRGFLCSEDCLNTLKAVEALGARVQREGRTVRVDGTGGRFATPPGVLDMGNSGTGIRLLAGLLAGHAFESVLTGDASLCTRPMRRIAEPLERMGASVRLTGPRGTAPVCMRGGDLRGIEYAMPMASAQVKSCVLFAGLFARGRTAVVEPRPTRDHTELALRALGVDVAVDGARVALEGSGGRSLELPPREWHIPGDFSSAAFWIAAAACRPGDGVRVEGVGLNPRRTALLDVLRRMGARICVSVEPGAAGDEPRGAVAVEGAGLTGTVVAGDEIPNLIDELPLVAVAGAMASGETVIRDAAELRVKESDRIASVAAGLRAMGVDVEEREDGMRVPGGRPIRGGGTVDSLGDHRVAMSMAVLALFADGPVCIRDTACIATSYPGFWTDFAAVASEGQVRHER